MKKVLVYCLPIVLAIGAGCSSASAAITAAKCNADVPQKWTVPPLVVLATPTSVDTDQKKVTIDRTAKEGAVWYVGSTDSMEKVWIEFEAKDITTITCESIDANDHQFRCLSATFCASKKPSKTEKYTVYVKFPGQQDPVYEDPEMVIYP